MATKRTVPIFFLVLALVACSRQDLVRKFASPADQATAQKYIGYLRDRQFQEMARVADPSIQNPQLESTLRQMSELMPPGAPRSIKVVGAQTNRSPGYTIRNLTFEYEFPDRWFLINVATKQSPHSFTIVGMHVIPLSTSLEDTNRFKVSGKSPLAYLTLGLAIAFVLLTLSALVLCVRTRNLRRKWLWVLFILVGVGRFAVNWTTGAWQVAPFSVQLFSASVAAQVYGPWIVAISLPLGAIVFLARRSRFELESPGTGPSGS